MIWLTLTIPAAALIVLVAHEGAHALFARSRGAKVTTFKPWPHRSADGQLRLGQVRWKYGENFKPSRWLWGAPLLADGLWISMGIGAGLLWPPALALAGAALLDAGWWGLGWLGWLPGSEVRDGQRWRNFRLDPLGQRQLGQELVPRASA